jgi:hypothetical protein
MCFDVNNTNTEYIYLFSRTRQVIIVVDALDNILTYIHAHVHTYIHTYMIRQVINIVDALDMAAINFDTVLPQLEAYVNVTAQLEALRSWQHYRHARRIIQHHAQACYSYYISVDI